LKKTKKTIWNIIGAPGSGKGRVLKHLEENVRDWIKLGTGDRCREEIENDTPRGKEIASYNHSGFLVPDEIMVPLSFEALEAIRDDDHQIIFTDAVTRTTMQYHSLATVAADWDYDLRTIFLADSIEVCYARLLEADRNRVDDTHEVIETRMREYTQKTLPAICFAQRYEKGLFVKIESKSLEDKLEQVLRVIENRL